MDNSNCNQSNINLVVEGNPDSTAADFISGNNQTPEENSTQKIDFLPFKISRGQGRDLIKCVVPYEPANTYQSRITEGLNILSNPDVQVGINQINTVKFIDELKKIYPNANYPEVRSQMPPGKNATPEPEPMPEHDVQEAAAEEPTAAEPVTPAPDPQQLLANLQNKQVEENLKEQSAAAEKPTPTVQKMVGKDDVAGICRETYPAIPEEDITRFIEEKATDSGRYGRKDIQTYALSCLQRDNKLQELKKEERRNAAAENQVNPWSTEAIQKPETGSEELEVIDEDEEFRKAFPPEYTDLIHPWNRPHPKRSLVLLDVPAIRNTLNDLGNAQRFFQECKGELLYDRNGTPTKGKPYSQWYVWNGTAWIKDHTKIEQSADNTALSFDEEARLYSEYALKGTLGGLPTTTDNAFIKEVFAFVKTLNAHGDYIKSRQGRLNMVDSSKDINGMFIDFNKRSNIQLIACKNGILDIKGRKFYYLTDRRDIERLKYQFPTRYIDRTYTPTAAAPENMPTAFIEHLQTIYTDNRHKNLSEDEIIKRRDESVTYMLRLSGYFLIGGNPEMLMLFMWGKTKNGKSATIDIWNDVLGEEAGRGSIAELCDVGNDKPRPKLAEAIGKTIAIFRELDPENEEEEEERNTRTDNKNAPVISTAIIKTITGERRTDLFRKMFENSQNNAIVCFPLASTNKIPKFKNLDNAILERLLIVPHDHYFPEEMRKDNIVDEIVNEEGDKIFSLMVDECIEYKSLKYEGRSGFPPKPQHWVSSTAELLSEVRYLNFINETYRTPTNEDSDKYTPKVTIYEEYRAWCNIQVPTIYPRLSNPLVRSDGNANSYMENNPEAVRKTMLHRDEIKALNKAFRILGFNDDHSGNVYYWEVIKKSDEEKKAEKEAAKKNEQKHESDKEQQELKL